MIEDVPRRSSLGILISLLILMDLRLLELTSWLLTNHSTGNDASKSKKNHVSMYRSAMSFYPLGDGMGDGVKG